MNNEQWMEEVRKEIEDVFYAECDLLSLDGYRKIPATVVRDDKRFIDRLLTLLTTQLEAARSGCKCNCAHRPHLQECYLNHCPHAPHQP